MRRLSTASWPSAAPTLEGTAAFADPAWLGTASLHPSGTSWSAAQPSCATGRRCRRPRSGLRRGTRYGAPQRWRVEQGQHWQPVVDRAAAGDEIIIEGGTYSQPCVVRKPDVCISAAPGAEVVLHCTAQLCAPACVSFVVPHWAGLRGITLRNDAGFGAVIQRSAAELTGCDISGVQGGVLVMRNYDNSELRPVLRDCKIHDSHKGPGVCAQDASVVIEGCELWGNADAGVLASGVSAPWIKSCTFRDGRGAGVALLSRAKGILRDCRITRNVCAGVLIGGQSDPVVWRNDFTDGRAQGLRVEEASRGVVEANLFAGNAECGAHIASGSETLLRWNAFRGGGRRDAAGVVVDTASPTVAQNTFHSIGSVCMQLCGGGRPAALRNCFTVDPRLGQPAVVVGPHSRATLDGNIVYVVGGTKGILDPVQVAPARGAPPQISGTELREAPPLPVDMRSRRPDGVGPPPGDDSSGSDSADPVPTPRRRSSTFDALQQRGRAPSAQRGQRRSSIAAHIELMDHQRIARMVQKAADTSPPSHRPLLDAPRTRTPPPEPAVPQPAQPRRDDSTVGPAGEAPPPGSRRPPSPMPAELRRELAGPRGGPARTARRASRRRSPSAGRLSRRRSSSGRRSAASSGRRRSLPRDWAATLREAGSSTRRPTAAGVGQAATPPAAGVDSSVSTVPQELIECGTPEQAELAALRLWALPHGRRRWRGSAPA
eukprot:TRINITY_DN14762_c0_g1_i1.p1 TRINITY_DN14762_c0_g1~~TRINITY_DN14762_c0_g1_i1.p1  ORF type:complete len:715 (+),score=153.53 TRINITY_DN14762_c0_g1_i1:101-2245(+)